MLLQALHYLEAADFGHQKIQQDQVRLLFYSQLKACLAPIGLEDLKACRLQLRLQKGYSLRELARRIGLSPNFLSNMERGHFPLPGEKKFVLIAENLEQNIDELLALPARCPRT
jgi:lambda repressor-like predicted transcriptional regulator